MLAVLALGLDREGNVYVLEELCESGLTLSAAAMRIKDMATRRGAEYLVASPDLWNRRQDTGRSGFEIMQGILGGMPMISADDRRVAGWRVVREYLGSPGASPRLKISRRCGELIRCLGALIYDQNRAEDASSEPHDVTHAPEALRYALMSCRARSSRDADERFDFSFGNSCKSTLKNYFY
jgi:phage terminase large subunit